MAVNFETEESVEGGGKLETAESVKDAGNMETEESANVRQVEMESRGNPGKEECRVSECKEQSEREVNDSKGESNCGKTGVVLSEESDRKMEEKEEKGDFSKNEGNEGTMTNGENAENIDSVYGGKRQSV